VYFESTYAPIDFSLRYLPSRSSENRSPTLPFPLLTPYSRKLYLQSKNKLCFTGNRGCFIAKACIWEIKGDGT